MEKLHKLRKSFNFKRNISRVYKREAALQSLQHLNTLRLGEFRWNEIKSLNCNLVLSPPNQNPNRIAISPEIAKKVTRNP